MKKLLFIFTVLIVLQSCGNSSTNNNNERTMTEAEEASLRGISNIKYGASQ